MIVKTTVALGVKITSLVSSWKSRAWVELDLRGLVPAESLADSKDECEVVLRDMQVDDVVQGEEASWSLWDGIVLGASCLSFH